MVDQEVVVVTLVAQWLLEELVLPIKVIMVETQELTLVVIVHKLEVAVEALVALEEMDQLDHQDMVVQVEQD